MKKVLFVMPNLRGGGAERVLVDLLNQLDKFKFKVTLLLFDKDGVYLDKVPQEIQIISIKDKFKFIPYRVWIRIYKYIPKLFYKIFIKEDYDTEIAFMEGLATNFVANSKNKSSKKIAWVHCDLLRHHWTKKKFLANREEECYNNFDEIVFVSNDSRLSFEELFKFNDKDKKVIYNPIISDEIIDKSNEIDVKFNDFTIVSVGRLNKQKGYDRLIKAHATLVKKYPHKLVIIGEGEERKILEDMIKDLRVEDTVELKGFIKNPYPYIKSADLFISSSRSEGYPLVIAESIILEKPIIATNITGPREMLDNGKYGLMCTSSYEGITNKLEEVLKNRELLKKYTNLSKERKKFFDYKSVIKEIESII